MPASGGFVGLTPGATVTGSAGANSIFLTPLVAQQNGSATAILLQTPNATTGISLKVLIYDSSHSALLATGSAVTATVNGYNRFALTAPLNLTAGTTYYVGYVCNATCNVTVSSSGGTSWFVSGGQSVASPANPLVGGASSANNLMVALELDGTGLQQTGFGPDYPTTGVTLSGANAVATFTAAANRGARGVYTRDNGSGKWYAEITVGGTINNNIGLGIVAPCWGVTQGTGSLTLVGLLLSTGVSNNGFNFGVPYIAGDTVGIAYDATNNTMQFNKNNGIFSATGAVTTTQWPLSLAVATGGVGTAVNFTLRDTAVLQLYAPPSGFLPWTPAPPITARQNAVTVISG